MEIKFVLSDIIEYGLGGDAWNRKDFLRHNPDKLAKALMECLA